MQLWDECQPRNAQQSASSFSKRDRYIRHVHGRTKEEMGKRQKAVTTNSAWVYVCWISLALSPFLSPSFSFSSSILTLYRGDIVASLLLLILFTILFFLRLSQFLYHCSHLTLILRVSLNSYLYTSQQSSAYALSLSINLLYKALMHLKNKWVKQSYFQKLYSNF